MKTKSVKALKLKLRIKLTSKKFYRTFMITTRADTLHSRTCKLNSRTNK